MRRKQAIPRGTKGERHRIQDLGDIRREALEIYWQVRQGDMPPAVGLACKALLELLAKLLTETPAEVALRELQARMAALRDAMHAQGREVPQWALPPPGKPERPN